MSRTLITGGAGFLGTNLSKYLLNQGKQVLSVDDFSTGKAYNIKQFEDNPNFEFLKHDLTKPFFPDNISEIYNLASPASPVHYQYNPIRTLKMGTLAIYNVLGIATRMKIPILQASTSEIYGDPLMHPQKEEYWGNVNPIGPRSCYDEGKRVAESLFTAYKNYNGTDIRIVRIFNTYGPFMSPEDGRVISNFITQALKGEDITVYGKGEQTRSFCYVDDLVNGLKMLMDSGFQDPVNMGNPDEYSINDIAEKIINATNSNSKIIFKDIPIDDPKKRRPDIKRAKETLHWTPQIGLDEGLNNTITWFQKLLNEFLD